VPTDRHLRELRDRGGMLEVPSGKAEQVTAQLTRGGFRADTHRLVEYLVSLDDRRIRSLVAMGPSAHHVADERGDTLSEADTPGPQSAAPSDSPVDVTVSVDVLRFRRG
jgi:23S rRNA (guanine745-N1)-methyltransferase